MTAASTVTCSEIQIDKKQTSVHCCLVRTRVYLQKNQPRSNHRRSHRGAQGYVLYITRRYKIHRLSHIPQSPQAKRVLASQPSTPRHLTMRPSLPLIPRLIHPRPTIAFLAHAPWEIQWYRPVSDVLCIMRWRVGVDEHGRYLSRLLHLHYLLRLQSSRSRLHPPRTLPRHLPHRTSTTRASHRRH